MCVCVHACTSLCGVFVCVRACVCVRVCACAPSSGFVHSCEHRVQLESSALVSQQCDCLFCGTVYNMYMYIQNPVTSHVGKEVLTEQIKHTHTHTHTSLHCL